MRAAERSAAIAEAELRRAEYAVCGAAMAGDLNEADARGLTSQMFFFSAPRQVFSTIRKLAADKKAADAEAVMATLAGQSLDGTAAEDVVCEMSDAYTTVTMLPAFVEVVKTSWRRREEVAAAQELVRALEGGNAGAIGVARERLGKWAEEGAPLRGLGLVSEAALVARNSVPPVELVEGLIAVGELALLTAPAKAGKSWFLLQLAMSIAGGVPFIGRKTRAGPVVYVNTEVGEIAWEGRCRLMERELGVSPTIPLYHANTRGQDVTLTTLAARLRADLEINSLKEVAVVVVDPFYSLAGGIDENSAGEVAAVMLGLQKLAEETGAAIIVAHHTGKGDAGSKSLFDRARGSSAFGGSVDVYLSLTARAEGRMVLDVMRRNARSPEPRKLVADFPLWRDDGEAEPDTGGRVGAPKKNTVEKLLEAFLEDDEILSPTIIAERTKMGRSTVYNLLQEAEGRGMLRKCEGGWMIGNRI